MKEKQQSRIKGVLSGIFKFGAWFDWSRVKAFTLYLGNGIKKFVVPENKVAEESFAKAVARLNLTDEDLLTKQKALYRLALLMVAAAVLILFYTGYLVVYGSFRSVMVSFMVMLIALVLAFRYHFWYYQMKSKKLGCTFQEWYREGLMGGKNG